MEADYKYFGCQRSCIDGYESDESSLSKNVYFHGETLTIHKRSNELVHLNNLLAWNRHEDLVIQVRHLLCDFKRR